MWLLFRRDHGPQRHPAAWSHPEIVGCEARHGFETHSASENGPHCGARAGPSLPGGHAIRALGKGLRTDVSQLTHRTCDLEEIKHGQFPFARKLAPLDHVFEKILAAEICVTIR